MTRAIRIVCAANGDATEADDYYVRSYQPATQHADGSYGDDGHLLLTRDIKCAKHFADVALALDYWRQDKGLRPDGKPNRPLTAYSVEVEMVPR